MSDNSYDTLMDILHEASGNQAQIASTAHCYLLRNVWCVHHRYTPPGEELPIAATIGSPNYGYRSVIRDLEANFLLVTNNTSLRKVWRLMASFSGGLKVFRSYIANVVTLASCIWPWEQSLSCDVHSQACPER